MMLMNKRCGRVKHAKVRTMILLLGLTQPMNYRQGLIQAGKLADNFSVHENCNESVQENALCA